MDETFTKEIDSMTNDFQGIVHQMFSELASKEIPQISEVTEIEDNIEKEGLVSDMIKVVEEQNQVMLKSFDTVKNKLLKKPLSTEKRMPLEKERHEVLETDIPLSSSDKNVDQKDVGSQDKGTKKVEIQEQEFAIEGKRKVKFSSSLISPFYIRKVDVSKSLSEQEKKVVEYIWSSSNDGRYVHS